MKSAAAPGKKPTQERLVKETTIHHANNFVTDGVESFVPVTVQCYQTEGDPQVTWSWGFSTVVVTMFGKIPQFSGDFYFVWSIGQVRPKAI